MIEKLEESKLKEYGFDEESIKRLMTWDNHVHNLHSNMGDFVASNIDQKIYSGKDALRLMYFKENINFPFKDLDLIPEYYSLKENKYLEKQKQIAGSLYKEVLAQEDFRKLEIEETNELIGHLKAHKMYERMTSKKESVEKCNWYLKWLDTYDIKAANKAKEKKIDFTKVFPTKEQFTEYDIRGEVEAGFGALMRQFIGMKAKTVNVSALIAKELRRLEDWRDNTDPPQITHYDNTINMYPFFSRGWEMPIRGSYTSTNNEFKFITEIKDQISEKYSTTEIPANYFEALSKVATEEIIIGAAHSKFYYWLKEQANTSNNKAPSNDPAEKPNWMKVFNDLDIDEPIKPQVYKTTTQSDRKVYFAKASMNLTKQYLLKFKKETYLLDKESLLAYIDALNLKKPTIGTSEGPEFNQVVFQADKNFFDFIEAYKGSLKFTKTTEEMRSENEANLFILQDRLAAVAYFSRIEGNGIKIPMFTTHTNDEFRQIVKEELKENKEARDQGNKTVPNPFRSRDMMFLERVQETKQELLNALFHEKFEEAKHYGFITAEWFAKKELKEVASMKAAGWFPIFEQWNDLLKAIAETGNVPQKIVVKQDQKTLTPKPKIHSEALQPVFDILKDFFAGEDQQQLREALENGNRLNGRLTFLDNGNRLADAFRRLINVDIITGCNKKELEAWIANNFSYKNGAEVKEFKSRYLQDIISANSDKCKKPILKVTKGKDGITAITKA